MRRILLYITALGLSLVAMAQSDNMRQLFLGMPQQVVPVLTKEARAQLVDNFDKRQKGEAPAEVRNSFNGYSAITALSDDFAEVKLDTQTSLQMRRLYLDRKSYLIGLIFTSKVVPEQSVLALYDQEWKRVPEEKYFQHPEVADFFSDPAQLQLNSTKKILSTIGALSYRYSWVEGSDVLKIEVTSFEEPMTQSLYPEATKWFKPSGVLYQWQRGQLRKER